MIEVKDIEKIYDILMDDNVVNKINENLGTLLMLIPELKPIIGFEHRHPHHHLDVWDHTLCALSNSIKDFDIRLVLLLHDIGKPFSYQEKEGIRHYKNHPKVSKEISKRILKRLEFKDTYIEEICNLIEKHDDIISNDDITNYPEQTNKLFEIQRCDALAHHPEKLEKRIKYLEKVKNKMSKSV